MDDRALLGRLVAGDADAFRELYDRHAEAVFGYALRIVGNRAAAEDATQDVFLAIVRRGRTYDPARPFLAWLLALARHAAIDQLRRRRPEAAVDRELLETAAARADDPAGREFVEAALARVPTPFREALWLCDVIGLTYGEAGDVMQCDIGTVGSRVSRGRRMLREHFARDGHAL